MTTKSADKTLVVVQLTGGNDFMNTIVPYTNQHYYDARIKVVMGQDEVLPINETLAINHNATPFKRLFDEGKMAIIQGIGYPNSNRSHFRGMDIWHTAEPNRVGNEGWLGQAIRELDPNAENVLTGVNIGMGLPRAMAVNGVPVTSVGDLESYGVMTRIEQEQLRDKALMAFKGIYGQAIGTGPVADYIGQTGLDVLKGADMLADVAGQYESTVEYADNQIAKNMRDIARIHFADLGTRIFYTSHGGYDTHANELPSHPKLMNEMSGAISDFMDDLEEHGRAEERDHTGLHRVRSPDARQRQRHRPRFGRRRLHVRQEHTRRSVQRISIAESHGLGAWRGPAAYDRLPRHIRHGARAVAGSGREADCEG